MKGEKLWVARKRAKEGEKMRDFLDKFFHSNDWLWRLARTIFQGVVGVVIQALAEGSFKPTQLIIPAVMCVLSPIMAECGKAKE